jgi:hypothetical protein
MTRKDLIFIGAAAILAIGSFIGLNSFEDMPMHLYFVAGICALAVAYLIQRIPPDQTGIDLQEMKFLLTEYWNQLPKNMSIDSRRKAVDRILVSLEKLHRSYGHEDLELTYKYEQELHPELKDKFLCRAHVHVSYDNNSYAIEIARFNKKIR